MRNPRSAFRNPQSLVRPIIRAMHPYVPGEQPKIRGLIKLNTNENPYPPSPRVLATIQKAVDGRLRLYPNPTAQKLREKLAKFHRCRPENIVVGNGSDELLALATRAFVEPAGSSPQLSMNPPLHPSQERNPQPMHQTKLPSSEGLGVGSGAVRSSFWNRQQPTSTVQFFTPSYSLYPVLAAIHGARSNGVPLRKDFSLPNVAELRRENVWDFHAPLTFITTPNAPSGRGYATSELKTLCRAQRGVVVLDEAYVDFASENALALALRCPNVLVARTFSKAYSLCFLRVGYFVGHPDLIEAVDKIRDSYNVNGLGQIGALATLGDLPYYRANFQRVVTTRERLCVELATLGFEIFPSQTNFVLVRPPRFPASQWLEKLRAHRILVRWFRSPEVRDYLRISIGTDAEAEALLRAARKILAHG